MKPRVIGVMAGAIEGFIKAPDRNPGQGLSVPAQGSRASGFGPFGSILNLLQTVFFRPVQGDSPAPPSLGADRRRYFVQFDRCEGGRRKPESAAFLLLAKERVSLGARSFVISDLLRPPAGRLSISPPLRS